jgi:hypothetical protein
MAGLDGGLGWRARMGAGDEIAAAAGGGLVDWWDWTGLMCVMHSLRGATR